MYLVECISLFEQMNRPPKISSGRRISKKTDFLILKIYKGALAFLTEDDSIYQKPKLHPRPTILFSVLSPQVGISQKPMNRTMRSI